MHPTNLPEVFSAEKIQAELQKLQRENPETMGHYSWDDIEKGAVQTLGYPTSQALVLEFYRAKNIAPFDDELPESDVHKRNEQMANNLVDAMTSLTLDQCRAIVQKIQPGSREAAMPPLYGDPENPAAALENPDFYGSLLHFARCGSPEIRRTPHGKVLPKLGLSPHFNPHMWPINLFVDHTWPVRIMGGAHDDPYRARIHGSILTNDERPIASFLTAPLDSEETMDFDNDHRAAYYWGFAMFASRATGLPFIVFSSSQSISYDRPVGYIVQGETAKPFILTEEMTNPQKAIDDNLCSSVQTA